MSLAKPTYRERLRSVRTAVDRAMMLAVALKDDLEGKVDDLDRRYSKIKQMSAKTYDRYEKYTTAIDEIDKIVGHLAEADDVSVKL